MLYELFCGPDRNRTCIKSFGNFHTIRCTTRPMFPNSSANVNRKVRIFTNQIDFLSTVVIVTTILLRGYFQIQNLNHLPNTRRQKPFHQGVLFFFFVGGTDGLVGFTTTSLGFSYVKQSDVATA